MSEVMARPVVAMDPDQVKSLNEQVERLGPGEPYMAVLVEGRVYVRATRGLPQTLIQLWRRNPAMMVPDSAGYEPEMCEVEIDDLLSKVVRVTGPDAGPRRDSGPARSAELPLAIKAPLRP